MSAVARWSSLKREPISVNDESHQQLRAYLKLSLQNRRLTFF